MKCTIKEIADALQLSRNTVSKALKGSSEVSISTQQRVFQKAQEMNYFNGHEKQNIGLEIPSSSKGSILFLTKTLANDSEFWGKVLKGIEKILSSSNYRLIIATMSDSDLKKLQFPAALNDPSIKGIIIVEICYKSVCKALLHYNLPIVTVDMPKDYYSLLGKFDIVTMENRKNIYRITEKLIQKGLKRFAFVGDLYSGNVGYGFLERYEALELCLKNHGLQLDKTCSFLHETDEDYRNFETVLEMMKSLSSLPDVFVCGNDWTAIQIMYALQFLGYKIPRDVNIIGFDNIPASERIVPALTTINTPKEYLGRAAARQIIERIEYPDSPCTFSQYATELIERDSTLD
ncbi:LacI family DNA-binding transcriptional regulator [Faecalicatena contorta]|uniref:Transcriptional regulator, LacI family n=1 Tax=Faecalicatena contorta TaxID=39482 RepID=A0A315ZU05_9FIRM|nr:LacI family DNA-binding transcriptional regulator [Faecalicatena contorta]PWJ48792.1 LacI family transcriptional regulator [Faecalicatena contorta]SUQ15215.1 transcriptional regulator, LacI family [Faecalicatena contorta]